MYDFRRLFLNVLSEDEEQEAIEIVSKLNTILKNSGVRFDINKSKKYLALDITINEEAINKGLKRNAGRKEKKSNKRYSDIIEMQKNMTADEIVSKLNMSRATYFRKCKKMQEEKEIDCNANYYF